MNIVVCVKQVPEVTDAELKIKKDGTGIIDEDLEFDVNEWDNYAIEEAVRLKEASGGRVTLVSLGDEDCEDALRQGLAMGADEAILIDNEDFENSDPLGIARGLFKAIQGKPFDLLLTGAQSSDDGWGQIGGILAEMFHLPHASLVVEIRIEGTAATVLRELESNTLEKVVLPLPAVLTIQSGINTPRYVSILGIKKVRKIEIEELDSDDLDLSDEKIGDEASCIKQQKMLLPVSGESAEMLTGSLDDICIRTAKIIQDKGGLV